MKENINKLVEKLYLAYYERPADKEGFAYWTQKLKSGQTLEKITKEFMNSEEAEQLYKNTTLKEKIEMIYQTLFDREPDENGLEFYLNKTKSGKYTDADVVLRIAEGAKGDDKKLLEKKLIYAEEFSQKLGEKINEENVEGIRNWIKGLKKEENVTPYSVFPSSKTESLLSGNFWKDKIITYSFPKEVPEDYYDTENKQLYQGWEAFNEKEKEVTKEILHEIESFSQITFKEVEKDGLIRFNQTQTIGDEKGFAFYPSETSSLGGDVWISKELGENGFNNGDLGKFVLLHEIGHALGLKHPFEGFPTLSKEEDNTNYTVMSYTPKRELIVKFIINKIENQVSANAEAKAWPEHYSLYDISALQTLYGINKEYNIENNIYNVSSLYKEKKHLALWDAGGIDTLDAEFADEKCIINLKPGSLSSIDMHTPEKQVEENIKNGDLPEQLKDWALSFFKEMNQKYPEELYTGEDNLSIADKCIIENVITGKGDDYIKDNQWDNFIVSGDGNDTIILQGEGCDFVYGGNGWDKVIIELPQETIETQEIDNGVWILEGKENDFFALLWGVEEVTYGT